MTEIPEHLPGEPLHTPPGPAKKLLSTLQSVVLVSLVATLTTPLWPFYLVAAAIWGWAPNVPRLRQIARYLRLTWTANPPKPGLSLYTRVMLTLAITRKVAVVPLWGLAWWLDELLYGSALRGVQVRSPLLEISAARSGSTQLARYLEDDPHLVAPNLLQLFFPYRWLWHLAPHTLGRLITPEKVRHKLAEAMPPEFIQRHEGDPFRTDTFEAVLYLAHLNHLAALLGPEMIVSDIGFAELGPHNQCLWEEDFIALADGLARKCLLDAGLAPDGRPRRFFIKGHFLAAADALARKYPDAIFLTMIREPAPRLQSAVNFMRANPMAGGATIPWVWLGQAFSASETAYCEIEQAWFTRPEGPRRCVLRFTDYVRDLEGALSRVYRECLDQETLPDYAPREHPPRERVNYLLNRSLAQVGVDEAALNARLADYIAWCRGEVAQ